MGDDADGDYKVGYGKPPREHQFKKGTSGNPRGRRKRRKHSHASLEVLAFEAAQQLVTGTVNGKTVTVTMMDMLVQKLFQQAFNGNLRHALQLFTLIEQGRKTVATTTLAKSLDYYRENPHEAQAAYERMIGKAERMGR